MQAAVTQTPPHPNPHHTNLQPRPETGGIPRDTALSSSRRLQPANRPTETPCTLMHESYLLYFLVTISSSLPEEHLAGWRSEAANPIPIPPIPSHSSFKWLSLRSLEKLRSFLDGNFSASFVLNGWSLLVRGASLLLALCFCLPLEEDYLPYSTRYTVQPSRFN